MTDTTSRMALPLIVPGQAQKEMVHNEALSVIDIALQASVVAMGRNDPPAEPEPGSCWIVGNAPTGDWAGSAGAIAGWTGGGWRFVAPRTGMAAWSLADGAVVRCDGTGWTLPPRPSVDAPAGGTITDAEARTAIAAILGALRAHGLIAG